MWTLKTGDKVITANINLSFITIVIFPPYLLFPFLMDLIDMLSFNIIRVLNFTRMRISNVDVSTIPRKKCNNVKP